MLPALAFTAGLVIGCLATLTTIGGKIERCLSQIESLVARVASIEDARNNGTLAFVHQRKTDRV